MNTAEATLPIADRKLEVGGVRIVARARAGDLDQRQLPSGIDTEIAKRLRNLDQESVVADGLECRRRLSRYGIAQVRIRMRLKQVAGLVSG